MADPANGAAQAPADLAPADLALAARLGGASALPLATAAWRLGDATLVVHAAAEVLHSIDELWRDCRERENAEPARQRVICRVHAIAPGEHHVEVRADDHVDLPGIARALLEPRPGDYVRERAAGSALVLARKDRPDVPLVAIAGPRAVLATAALPPLFLRDFVVATVLRVQSSVLFLHAASVAVHGHGVLVAGRAGAGKTTLAMTLAARGHGLLGDDFAALRRASRELLPLRRTLHVRKGPRAKAVDRALHQAGAEPVVELNGRSRLVTAPSRMFAEAIPVHLAAAVFLRSFRRAPAIERFSPSRADMSLLRTLPIRHQWGIAAGARLVRFLALLELLATVPCYLLDVAAPEATADLVETTLHHALPRTR